MYQGKYVNNDTPPRKKKPSVKQSALLQNEQSPKHSKKATIIFYSIYGLLILSFIIGMIVVMAWLQDWLVEFEASQPDNASVRIFEENFSRPDWKHLYEIATRQDGYKFASAEDYAVFMTGHTKGASITMVETSAGLSGGKKYIVRAVFSNGDTMDFATFTLTDKTQGNDVIPDWQLGEVILRVDNKLMNNAALPAGYTFLIRTGNTVTVNGTVLDESHILRTVTTKADPYLPDGLSGYQLTELYIDGLASRPEVLVTDSSGNEVAMTFDSDTSTYTQDLTSTAISEEEQSSLLNAATTYCKYMIRAVGKDALKGWFDSGKPIYATITGTNSWMQGYSSFSFSEEQTVSSYYRYSDSLFSAKVTLTLNVKRTNGTIKPYDLDTTFFMERQGSKWKVIEMTNVDVQEQITEVRMTYLQTDGTLIRTEMLDAGANSLTPPTLDVPAGKTFRGWATKSVGDNGENLFTIIYLPDENGNVLLPTQNTLKPTTLYAIFGQTEVD